MTEVQTRVPLTADDDLEAIIAKARYVEFLEKTNMPTSARDYLAHFARALAGR